MHSGVQISSLFQSELPPLQRGHRWPAGALGVSEMQRCASRDAALLPSGSPLRAVWGLICRCPDPPRHFPRPVKPTPPPPGHAPPVAREAGANTSPSPAGQAPPSQCPRRPQPAKPPPGGPHSRHCDRPPIRVGVLVARARIRVGGCGGPRSHGEAVPISPRLFGLLSSVTPPPPFRSVYGGL